MKKFLRLFIPIITVIAILGANFAWGAAEVFAADPNGNGKGVGPYVKKGRITPADRLAAAKNAAAARKAAGITSTTAAVTLVPGPGGTLVPDYFGLVANYANSPAPVIDATGNVTALTGIRKFVDALPDLTLAVATKDILSYPAPASDYYEIGLVEYKTKLHADLPETTLRGYVQLKTGNVTGTIPLFYDSPVNTKPIYYPGTTTQVMAVSAPSYLGPVIVADSGKPVRVKFYNLLPTTANGGDLFIPVDTTYMGAGSGPTAGFNYTQNRATLHLHGGTTPWISDGTPHQWTTPAGESTAYPKGVSVQNVPDMDGGIEPAGTLTFYYSNQQSARLMFYHDHAYGITRLNVYAGEAAGYLLLDDVDKDLIGGTNVTGVNPNHLTLGLGTPLVIQDKTFVDSTKIAAQDPTWQWGTGPVNVTTGRRDPKTGDLWFPHVYMPNQNPWDITGANAMGRWDYGPWFWPPSTNLINGPVTNPYILTDPNKEPLIPGVPNVSGVPEAFMDTPIINGKAYPTTTVPAGVVRFRILNAANDRFQDLSLFVAANLTVGVTNGGSGYANPPALPPAVTLSGAGVATATVVGGVVTGITVTGATGYTTPPTVMIAPPPIPLGNVTATAIASVNDDVKMVPFNSNQNAITPFPVGWYDVGQPFTFDDRAGGVPDPATRGPAMIQIGTEGGFLANATVILNQPVNFEYNRKNIVVMNVKQHALFLGPAERADVLVDFSKFAGKTLILYNDGPAPVPAFDPRNDYYTGNPDQTSTGGAPTTLPGYGPNTRTIMRIVVGPAILPGADSSAQVDYVNATFLGQLQTAIPAAFAKSQDTIIVPQAPYNSVYGAAFPADAYARIQDTSMSFTPIGTTHAVGSITLASPTFGGSGYTAAPAVTVAAPTVPLGNVTATATATLATAGGVRSVAVTNDGSKYTSAPTVTFSAPTTVGGVLAVANAIVVSGKVTAVNVTNPGSGYTAPPSVFFSLGGGSKAAATATLGFAIASITVTNGGSGYTGTVPPAVTVAVPSPSVPLPNVQPVTATAQASFVLKMALQPKAIQELFTVDYGRMNATLGVELPNTTGVNQTTIPFGYIDPPTELIKPNGDPKAAVIGSLADGTQIWKITHNGVDTHAIHVHMFNMQLINRVGWDGAVRPPNPNELGWKDTLLMSPLEDIIVAIRPIAIKVPFDLPNSWRPLDVTQPLGSTVGFFGVDPLNHPVAIVNKNVNFGWEYVWHCHLLGHEENDMMRPIAIAVAPKTPSTPTATLSGNKNILVTWPDNTKNETKWTIQRATVTAGIPGPWANVGTLAVSVANGSATGGVVSFTDTTVTKGTTYVYRVIANNVVGDPTTYPAPAVGFPTMSADSAPSLTSNAVTR